MRRSQYTEVNAIVKLQVAMGTKGGKMLLTTATQKAAAWYEHRHKAVTEQKLEAKEGQKDKFHSFPRAGATEGAVT